MSERRWGWVLVVAGSLAFAALCWWRVPWTPVPGGPPGPLPAGEVFSPAEVDRAEHFVGWARLWSFGALAVSLLTVLLAARSTRLRTWLAVGRWWVKAPVGVLLVSGAVAVATLPLGLAGWELRRRHELSTQSAVGFLVDDGKSLLVNVAMTSLAVLVLMAIARRRTRDWPLWCGLGAASLVVLGSFVYPLTVEPVFNSFRPLSQGPLRDGVFALAAQEKVPIDDVLVADASRRTTTLNAYVSGFGSTRRVVLYDTLVDDLPTDQALSVVAHELAHAKYGDVVTGTALGAAGALAGVGLLALLVGGRIRTAAVVPVVLGLAAIGSVLVAPLQNAVSRQIETRADVAALAVTPVGPFVEMQHRLAVKSLSDPTPPQVLHWWFGSHPTTLERIAIARR